MNSSHYDQPTAVAAPVCACACHTARLTAEEVAPAVGISVERLREAQVELEVNIARPPMEASPQSQALRRRYEPHAARVGLSTGEAPRPGGGSDANILSALGVPCIDGLGPWGEHFHNTAEWCSLDSLRRRTQALACFLAQACGVLG